MTFPSRGDTRLAAWARAYAANNWPVFPLRPRDKTPLTANGFKDASVHPEQVELWWRQWPHANIGLPTGHHFDVLDLDGPTAINSLDQLLGGRYRHTGPVSLTGKGWHCLFAPTGAGNGTSVGFPDSKIDFRGRGGYIVAPPSVHPLGHLYTWSDRGPDSPLPQPPDWLYELVDRTKPRDRLLVPAPIDPRRPALDYMRLVAEQVIPEDQLPRALRKRAMRPSIIEVCASKKIPLTPRANYYVTKCIFHDDSTPSLAIYDRDDTFHCYGCGAHGDSFDLLNDPPTHI